MSASRIRLYLIILFLSIFTICVVVFIDSIRPLEVVTIGTKSDINIKDFFKSTSLDAKFITDVSKIDTNKIGVYQVTIKVHGSIYNSKLEIVDKSSPIVEVQDLVMGYYEEVTPELFIVKVEDESDYTIYFDGEFKKKLGEQTVSIVVEDTAGNKTKKTAKLILEKVKENITMEAGSKFNFSYVLYSADKVKDKKIIKDINYHKLGVQELIIEVEGDKYTINVTIEDTVAPSVKTNNITIWWDEKVSSIDKFIKKITDQTSVKKEYLNEIDYKKIGTQDVKIRVTDEAGNKTDVKAKLTIKKDTTGPTIKNLTTINVVRGNSFNVNKGVTAVDDHDGKVSVSCASVSTPTPGTYYSKCTAKDSSGNVTTKNRKIVVTGNTADIKEKLQSVANSFSGSQTSIAEQISKWVYKSVTYNSSYNSRDMQIAAWTGLTTKKGDCFTKYALTKYLLDMKGITNKQINTKNYSHYWNFIYVDGVWRHLDSTYKNTTTPMTDSEYKKASGKTWDTKKWSTT